MMAYARQCPYCGAYLDPCEICDCQMEEKNTAPGIATSGGGANERISTMRNKNEFHTTTLHHKEEKVNV